MGGLIIVILLSTVGKKWYFGIINTRQWSIFNPHLHLMLFNKRPFLTPSLSPTHSLSVLQCVRTMGKTKGWLSVDVPQNHFFFNY